MYKKIFEDIGDVQTFLDRDVVRSIIGKNYDFYRELWLQHEQQINGERAKIKVKGRWNWLAFIFIPAWYGYRKMHSMFLGLLAAFSALIFYEIFYDTEILKSTSALFGFLALYSRAMYLQIVVARVKAYDKLPNKERKEWYLKRYANASKKLAWLYGVGYILIIFAVILIAGYLRDNPNIF